MILIRNSRKLALTFMFFISLISQNCTDKKKDCVKAMMDDGYTYDEAVESCDDAARDSNIRAY